MSNYQPTWNSKTSNGGSKRDAVKRFEAIAKHTDHLKKGFTAVDIGAHTGYFCVRMAEDLGASVTAVDGEPTLGPLVGDLEARGVSVVPHYLKPSELAKLAGNVGGHFDVGLCLSVFHHVDWWKIMLDDMLKSCRLSFIEVALPEETLNPRTVEWRKEALELVSGLPGAEEVCRVPGFDDRHLRPTFKVPGLT